MPFGKVTFFIGWIEKGHTKEVCFNIDEYILQEKARKGAQHLREFLRHILNEGLVTELLQEFLKELFQQQEDEQKRREIFGEGPLTKEKMEVAIQNLIDKRR